jgi:hypothetical protein
MGLEFYINIEDSAGIKQGSGPITSATMWLYTPRLDNAGEFSFMLPATDPAAFTVQKKRVARAWANIAGDWVEVGAGIIDKIEREPKSNGTTLIRVSGNDMLAELAYRSVLDLRLYAGGLPVSHSVAVSAVAGYAPSGWAITPDPSPPNDSIYGRFNGETVLAGLRKVADKCQTHFYAGTGRQVIFANTFTSSGLRAIVASGDLTASTCAITSITERVDTHDLITRIYPKGSGNGDVALTLKGTNRVAPSGFTLNKASNFIMNDTANAQYGRIEKVITYRDVGPVSNTTSDIQAAANMLFDAALETLKRHSTEMETATYTLAVAGCQQMLRPMQQIRVVYRDLAAGLDINADLNILEATWRVDESGIMTTGLVVSTADRWPSNDTSTLADNIEQSQLYQALPQLNANSYTLTYNKNIDVSNNATLRFRIGDEVTQLQQILLEFQLLPFESTVKSVGGATSGSGSLHTSIPSINVTGSGGNNETSLAGTTVTSAVTPIIGTVTPIIGTVTPIIGDATPIIGNTTPIIGGTSLVTGNPAGSGVDASGFHRHSVSVEDSTSPTTLSPPATPLYIREVTASNFKLYANMGKGSVPQIFYTNNVGEHTHAIGSHNHTIAVHTHTIAAHSHTIAAHTHTIASHDHTIAAHSHTMATHTHTMAQHTHSLNNHTHNLAESISAVYGIFRQTGAKTYTVGDLQYRVNGGAWLLASGATSMGAGWYQLDLTAALMNADTFRPLQTNNTVEIRARATLAISSVYWSGVADYSVAVITAPHGLATFDQVKIEGTTNFNGIFTVEYDTATIFQFFPSGNYPDEFTGSVTVSKTVTVDAQLTIRNIIQATAFA